jgi:hemerythrin-like domain-containing protein
MKLPFISSRRTFLRDGGMVLAASAAGTAFTFLLTAGKQAEENNEEISPLEDLMREHGLLRRVLLIYAEVIRRIEANETVPVSSLASAVSITRDFIENYHEKLEEDHVFPRFRKAGKLVNLVGVLEQQHEAGRRLTGSILQLATVESMSSMNNRSRLAELMRLFIHMYEPHAAREDTVLFPAFHGIVSQVEFGGLGEEFEKKEDELFGADGFSRIVAHVAEIEKKLGIFYLQKFTPNV